MGEFDSDWGLVIVPAGAGAGKTHRIKTQLSDWVKRKVVRPERILAVTFTEAAAGELRERIRAGLLADWLVAEAMAVERAYVSTIHGLGLRLLTEHALAAGASLQPRHLGDAERDLLIRQALAHARSLDPIKAEPERFGYQANWQKGETVEDSLRGRVLSMIDLLRGLGDKGRDPGLIAPALTRLDTIYGEVLTDPAAARDALVFAVRAMLASFPEGGMATVTAKGPRETLEKNLTLLRRVEREPKEDIRMSIDITTLLPSSFPGQNTHRHVVFTAEAQPDEFARLEIAAADAIAAARAALRAFEADPIADGTLKAEFRVLADFVVKRRVLGEDFVELAEEMVQHLAQIGSETPSDQIASIQRLLADALALSRRVLDLLAAERDIGWRRGIGRD